VPFTDVFSKSSLIPEQHLRGRAVHLVPHD
jgi:hypothetical protein